MPDYKLAARRAAKKYGLPAKFFERQIGAESNFDPTAGSPAGAQGIAQIMPGTAKAWGVNLNDGRVSDDLDAAAKNMSRYVKKYGFEGALRAYNAGEGAVEKSKGYGETNAYVKKIMSGLGDLGNPRNLDSSRASSRDTSTGASPRTTEDASGQRSVYDVIRSLSMDSESEDDSGTDDMLQRSQEMLMAAIERKNAPTETSPTPTGESPSLSNLGDSEVDAMVKRADTFDKKKFPYKWGGGHGKRLDVDAGDAIPVDCSGAVSAVLGIDPMVSGGLAKWGKPGRGKNVTIYANDEHVLMEINGHFFGTSKSNPGGGAGWIPRSKVSKAYLSKFTARHPPGK